MITLYPNVFAKDNFGEKHAVQRELEVVATYIENGSNDLDEKTQQARRLVQGDVHVYRKFKAELPTAVFGGTFKDIPANDKSLEQHSGYVVVDYDNVTDVDAAKTELKQYPEVALCFVSPSGTGLKPVVRVEPVPKSAEEHKHAWAAVVKHLAEVQMLPEPDATGADVSRKCFLAHDADVIYNGIATAVHWEKPKDVETDAKTSETRFTGEPLPPMTCKEDWAGIAAQAGAIPKPADTWKLHENGYWILKVTCPFCTGERYGYLTFNDSNKVFTYNCYGQTCKSDDKPNAVSLYQKAGYTQAPAVFSDRGTFLPVKMREVLHQQDFHFVTLPTDNAVRIYENGVYRLDTGRNIEKAVEAIIGEQTQPRMQSATRTSIENATMLEMPPKGHQPCLHTETLNLTNGILDIATGNLTPHTPEDIWIQQLPIAYDANATCPEFDMWLHEVQEGRMSDIQLAHEIIGMCLLQYVPFPQVYALYGRTHTGKSSFLKVVTALLGTENISDVSFNDLGNTNDKFASSDLAGSLANLDFDVTVTKIDDVGLIKKIAGGEPISVQGKGKDRFTLRPYSTMLMATNDELKSADWTDGWYSRLCVLTFDRQHLGDNVKRDAVNKMTTPTELSGILNHALAGIQRVLETGHHTHSESVVANRVAFQENDNIVLRWFNENYQRARNDSLDAESVEENFKKWCEDEEIKKIPKTKLRETLKSQGILRRRIGSIHRTYVYEGLAEAD